MHSPVTTDRPELSVVVPVYNERECIGPLVRAIDAAMADASITYEVILVDDGSTDDTFDTSVAMASVSVSPVRVIQLQRNFGQTAAMQAGMDAAAGTFIATLDGDLQNDPGDIPAMLERLQERDLDLLVGRRRNRQDGLWLRLIPSWIANRLIAAVTGVRIHDYGCSLKLYRASIIKQVQLMGEMHRFIPAWVAGVTHPSRIGEMDVRHHPRRFGQSKYGISRTVRVVLDLLSVLFFMRFRARPGHFFGTCGLVVGAIGMMMLGTVAVSKFGFGQDIGTRPMLLVGSVAMLSAIQLICVGVLSEMIARMATQAGVQKTYLVRQQVACPTTAEHPLNARRAA